MLKTKVYDPKLENQSKVEPNPRLLHFSPKSFAHNFRSFCCCFRSIRLKNKSVKSLGHLTRKFTKVTNQHMMTCFCTETILTSILVILLLFRISIFKKMLKNKSVKSLDHLTRKLTKVTNQHMMTCFCVQTIRTSLFCHFIVVSHQYG